MKFRDFFVPKYVHSNPEVRIKFINKTKDTILLQSIIENDQDNEVIQSARDRMQDLIVSHSEND